jgi:hypothetical protein
MPACCALVVCCMRSCGSSACLLSSTQRCAPHRLHVSMQQHTFVSAVISPCPTLPLLLLLLPTGCTYPKVLMHSTMHRAHCTHQAFLQVWIRPGLRRVLPAAGADRQSASTSNQCLRWWAVSGWAAVVLPFAVHCPPLTVTGSPLKGRQGVESRALGT